MKKVLMIFAAGALLASCSSKQDKEAAAGFCECYNIQDEAAQSTSVTEIMEAAEKMQTCVKSWQATFEGKISEDGFSSELKEKCPDAHKKAEEMGMFN